MSEWTDGLDDLHAMAVGFLVDYRRRLRALTTEAERQANLDAFLDSLGDDQ